MLRKKYLNTWYDWLFNCIPEPITKIVYGFKDKIVSLFNTNTPKQTVYGRGNKLSKPKRQNQSEENKINSIRNPFILKRNIDRNFWTLFEIEEENKKMMTIILNRKE